MQLEDYSDLVAFFNEGRTDSGVRQVRRDRLGQNLQPVIGTRNIFATDLTFDVLLDHYIEAMKPSGRLTDVPGFRLFYPLLRDSDIDRLESQLDLHRYPDVADFYFVAGAYEKSLRQLQKSQAGSEEKERYIWPIHAIVAKHLGEQPEVGAFGEVRLYPTMTCHLCRDFQKLGIIGNEARMIALYYRVEQIGQRLRAFPEHQRNVLIRGESGMGKELFARAIHERSGRSGSMIQLNCSTLPPELADAELFGHEKGAFTGATEGKKGVFEAAEGGTVQLDEIDKMAPPHQSKLLRVLQEREIRKVGATESKKVDVLCIATTNRDLGQMVQDNKFLPDLHNRIGGAAITVPSLSERRHDVPNLVQHVLMQYPEHPLWAYRFQLAFWCREQVSGEFSVRNLENLVEDVVIRSYEPVRDQDAKRSRIEAALVQAEQLGLRPTKAEITRLMGFESRSALYKPMWQCLIDEYVRADRIKPQ
jgi:transcriptional regulator with AAA-type ATPase domain